jgi:hypothetical protein
MTHDERTGTRRNLASAGGAVTVALPSPVEVARLPANHRRVVAALLATLSRHLAELSASGAIAASGEDVGQLADLARALGSGPPEGRDETLRQALLVQLDDVEPGRLAGYGPLSPEQEGTLNALVAALRVMLEPPPR